MSRQKSPTNGAYAGGRGVNSKSTATAVQQTRILSLLAIHPHNTEELQKAGIFRVSARIRELRRLDHDIRTVRISLIDRDGFVHSGVALYSLGDAA